MSWTSQTHPPILRRRCTSDSAQACPWYRSTSVSLKVSPAWTRHTTWCFCVGPYHSHKPQRITTASGHWHWPADVPPTIGSWWPRWEVLQRLLCPHPPTWWWSRWSWEQGHVAWWPPRLMGLLVSLLLLPAIQSSSTGLPASLSDYICQPLLPSASVLHPCNFIRRWYLLGQIIRGKTFLTLSKSTPSAPLLKSRCPSCGPQVVFVGRRRLSSGLHVFSMHQPLLPLGLIPEGLKILKTPAIACWAQGVLHLVHGQSIEVGQRGSNPSSLPSPWVPTDQHLRPKTSSFWSHNYAYMHM